LLISDQQIIANEFANSLSETFKLDTSLFNPPEEVKHFNLPNLTYFEKENINKVTIEAPGPLSSHFFFPLERKWIYLR
jgi:hypothetical protein